MGALSSATSSISRWSLPDQRSRRRHRTRRRLLCDASGSMERYSRFLLEFIYGLRREWPDTEVAVFATRLNVITDLLRAGSPSQSLREAAVGVMEPARSRGRFMLYLTPVLTSLM